jgi:hypothetical protein
LCKSAPVCQNMVDVADNINQLDEEILE